MQAPDHDGGLDLQRVYGTRFAGKTNYRDSVWKVLAPYFGQHCACTGKVLDLGAGYCEFINNCIASEKYAMDLNPEIHRRATEEVTVLQQNCAAPWPLPADELDAVFTSNFLEHLPNKDAVLTVLGNAYISLKPGGHFVAMRPNIKYVPGAYWDFFDHYVELTEMSLAEALRACGFEIEKVFARFLPYTMSAGREYPVWMLRMYLALPAVWPMFGKQFLVIGRKPLSGKSNHSEC